MSEIDHPKDDPEGERGGVYQKEGIGLGFEAAGGVLLFTLPHGVKTLAGSPALRGWLSHLDAAGFGCGIELITYCVMGNHFHALVWVPNREVWLKRFAFMEPLARYGGRCGQRWSRMRPNIAGTTGERRWRGTRKRS